MKKFYTFLIKSALFTATFLAFNQIANAQLYPEVACSQFGQSALSCQQCFDARTLYSGEKEAPSDDLINTSTTQWLLAYGDSNSRQRYEAIPLQGTSWSTPSNLLGFGQEARDNTDIRNGRKHVFIAPSTPGKPYNRINLFYDTMPNAYIQFNGIGNSSVDKNSPTYLLKYYIWTSQLDKNTNRESAESLHTECVFYYSAWCGDGIKQSGKEECDGTDGVGVGQSCNSSCELIDAPTPPPTCNNITVTPKGGNAPVNSSVTCSASYATEIKVDCGNGQTFTEAGNLNGAKSITKTCNYATKGNYTPTCVIDGTITNNSCTASVTVSDPLNPSITVDKNDTDNKDDTQLVEMGAPAKFTITVRNNGNEALKDIVLTDSLTNTTCSGSVTLPSSFPSNWTNVRVTANTNNVLDPGESFSYECLRPNTTENYVNGITVTAKGITTDRSVNDSDTTNVTVNKIFDLALTKKVSGEKTTFKKDEEVTFIINVYNQGNIAATNVKIVDYIPAGLTLSDLNWTTNANKDRAYRTISKIEPGKVATLTIKFKISAENTKVVNWAEIADAKGPNGEVVTDIDSTMDENPSNDCHGGVTYPGVSPTADDRIDGNGKAPCNANNDEDDHDPAEITVSPRPVPNISVDKVDANPTFDRDGRVGNDTQTIRYSEEARFKITVTNTGTEDLKNVVLEDTVAPECATKSGTFVDFTNKRFTKIGIDGRDKLVEITTTNTGNVFKVGSSFSYECVKLNTTENYTNSVTVKGVGVESNGNVSDSDTTPVKVSDIPEPRLTIEKYDSNPRDLDKKSGNDTQSIIRGDKAVFTIKVTNTGTEPVSSITITDLKSPSCAGTITLPNGSGKTNFKTGGIQGTILTDGILSVGEWFSYECEQDNVLENFTNTACVVSKGTQTGANSPSVCDDTSVVVKATPDIDVDKVDANPNDKDGVVGNDTQTVVKGEKAIFKIRVTNDGQENIKNISLIDPNGPACASNGYVNLSAKTFTNRAVNPVTITISYPNNADNKGNHNDDILQIGEYFEYTCEVENTQKDYVNTITVSGFGVDSDVITTSTNETEVKVYIDPNAKDPKIKVTKQDGNPNDLDGKVGPANANDTQTVTKESKAIFNIIVENNGTGENDDIKNIILNDPLAPNCSTKEGTYVDLIRNQFTPAVGDPIRITQSGSGNHTNNILEKGEKFTYNCERPGTQSSYTNTVIVSGKGVETNKDVSAQDTTKVVLSDKEFDLVIKKELIVDQGSIVECVPNREVEFKITVSNVGQIDATNVSVKDEFKNLTFVSAAGAGTWSLDNSVLYGALGDIKSGESKVSTIKFKVNGTVNGKITNTASVGTTNGGNTDVQPDDNTDEVICPPPADFDLKITKTAVNSCVVDSIVTFKVKVENVGDVDATNIVVTDTFPANLELVAGQGWTKGTGNTATRNFGNIVKGGTAKEFEIKFKVKSIEGQIKNIAKITGFDGNYTDKQTADNTDEAVCNPGTYDLSIKKEFTPGTTPQCNSGGTVKYRITVTNEGTIDATGVKAIDRFNANALELVTNNSAIRKISDGVLELNFGDIPATGTKTKSMTLEFKVKAGFKGAIKNSVEISETSDGYKDVDSTENNGDKTEDDYSEITCGRDLEITKELDSSHANTCEVGSKVRFKITVTNKGNEDFTNVEVTDIFPSGLKLIESNLWKRGNDDNSVKGNFGTIKVGEFKTEYIEFTVTSLDQVLKNIAKITGSDNGTHEDADTSNNSDAAICEPEYNLKIEKLLPSNTCEVGKKATFRVRVTNVGKNTATNVIVTDTYPNSLELVNGNGWEKLDGNVATRNFGTIAKGATVEYDITFNVKSAGAVNKVKITSSNGKTHTDSNVSDDTDTASCNPPTTENVSIVKTIESTNTGNACEVGKNVRFKIVVTNHGDTAVNDIAIKDTFPTAFTFVGGTDWQVTGNTATQQIGSIGAKQSVTKYIELKVNTLTGAVNTASIVNKNLTAYSDSVSADNISSASCNPNIVVTKTLNTPNKCEVNSEITYTIVVKNNGNVDATNVLVTDTFPADKLEFLPGKNTGWNLNGNTLTRTIPSLAKNGGQETFTLTFKVKNNTGGIKNDVVVNNNGQTSSDSDICNPTTENLSIVKTIESTNTGNACEVGKNVRFKIVVTNHGDTAVNDIAIKDTFPTAFTFVGGTDWQVTGNTATQQIGSIGAKQSVTKYIELKVNTLTGAVNTASIVNKDLTAYSDSVAADNVSSASCTDDLSITKTLDSSEGGKCEVNQEITYNIVVRNNNSDAVSNVVVTDTFPADKLEFLPAQNTGWTLDGNKVTRTISSIAANSNSETLKITFKVKSNTGGITNTAKITESEGNVHSDSNSANDTSTTTCGGEYDLSLTKTVVTATPSRGYFINGDSVTFRITVKNEGNVTANNIEVIDYIPSGLTYRPGDNSSNPWTLNGSNITKTIDGQILPGQSKSVDVNLYINNIPTNGSIRNIAEINKDDGDDVDSTPGNNNPTEDDQDDAIINGPDGGGTGTGCKLAVSEISPDIGEKVTFSCETLNANNVRMIFGDGVESNKIVLNPSDRYVTTQFTHTYTSKTERTAYCLIDDKIISEVNSQCTLKVNSTSGGCTSNCGGGTSPSCTGIAINEDTATGQQVKSFPNLTPNSLQPIRVTCMGNNATREFGVDYNGDGFIDAVRAGTLSAVFPNHSYTAPSGNSMSKSENPRCYAAGSTGTFQVGVRVNSNVTNYSSDSCITTVLLSTTSGGSYPPTPPSSTCGNGVIESGEQCEMSSTGIWPAGCVKPGAGVTNACKMELCLDGTPIPSNGQCPYTVPEQAYLQFGPSGKILLGNGDKVFKEIQTPFLYNGIKNNTGSDYNLPRKLCVKVDGNIKLGTLNPSGFTVCSDEDIGDIYVGMRVKLGMNNGYSNGVKILKSSALTQELIEATTFINSTDPSYKDTRITTTMSTASGVNTPMLDSALEGKLEVRVAKGTISGVGGGSVYVNDASKLPDINKIGDGFVNSSNPNDKVNTSFDGTVGTKDGGISSGIKDVKDVDNAGSIGGNSVNTGNFGTISCTPAGTSINIQSATTNYRGNTNVKHVTGDLKIGDATVPNLDLSFINGPRTYVVERGNVYINKNFIPDHNVAIIVRGGNIIIDSNVTNIRGTFITIKGSSCGGKFTGGGVDTKNILNVSGSLYGDISELVSSRSYMRTSPNGGSFIQTGTVVSYNSSVLRNPAPLVGDFIGEYLSAQKVAK